MSLWNDLLIAFQFLTRIPVPTQKCDDASFSRAAIFFPFVGLVVGSAGASIYSLPVRVNLQIRVLVVLIFFVLVTGALHEDGLADTADALGGGWTRERALEIMRDSRIGSYGAIALVLSLLARFVLLLNLPGSKAWAYLIAAHVLCRWSSLPLGYFLQAARTDTGSGVKLAGKVSLASLIAATVFVASLQIVLLGRTAWFPALATIVITALSGAYYRKRLGGVTGDCFGATNQLVEIGTYFCGCL